MNLNFEIDSIRDTEFGVGRDVQRDIPTYASVPTDDDVKRELANFTSATVNAIDKLLDDSIQPRYYSPSEKYNGTQYLILPLEDENCQTIRDLFDIDNLQLDSNALQNVQNVFCYFAGFIDTEGKQLVGLRRASQFKSVKKEEVMGLFGDRLTLVNNPLFALNNDFDLLIDSEHVHILRPNGFEYMGKLQEAMRSRPSSSFRPNFGAKKTRPKYRWASGSLRICLGASAQKSLSTMKTVASSPSAT